MGVRQGAAVALGRIGDPRGVEPLAEALGDEFQAVRRLAAEALRKMGDVRAVGPLVEALKDEDADVRMHALKALRRIGDPRAVEPLAGMLKEKDKAIKLEAVVALGEMPDARAVNPLIQMLKDEEVEIRRAASETLRKIGGPSTRSLVKALKDKNGFVRKFAADLLDGMGWKPERDEEKAHYMIGRGERSRLIEMGEAAIKPLVHSLSYMESFDRRFAVKVLGELHDRRAVEPLIRALEDEDAQVREEAAWALSKIVDERAVEPLIERLNDIQAVRVNAVIALREIGDRRAIEPLIRVHEAGAVVEMGDVEVAGALIDWLFQSEPVLETRRGVEARTERMKHIFGDYTELVVEASAVSEPKDETYEISMEAVKKLCEINTPISSNILHKVSAKSDYLVFKGHDEINTDYPVYDRTSFESQREMARNELGKRGNPPYDPKVYLDRDAWKLARASVNQFTKEN
jgi:HEAT repeat protein